MKNAAFPPSGKHSLRLPALGISPRSFLSLAEAGKGGREQWRKAEEGSRKERLVTVDLGEWCVETSRPVCVGAAEDLSGTGQEMKGK